MLWSINHSTKFLCPGARSEVHFKTLEREAERTPENFFMPWSAERTPLKTGAEQTLAPKERHNSQSHACCHERFFDNDKKKYFCLIHREIQ